MDDLEELASGLKTDEAVADVLHMIKSVSALLSTERGDGLTDAERHARSRACIAQDRHIAACSGVCLANEAEQGRRTELELLRSVFRPSGPCARVDRAEGWRFGCSEHRGASVRDDYWVVRAVRPYMMLTETKERGGKSA